jgi:hypothetical protein
MFVILHGVDTKREEDKEQKGADGNSPPCEFSPVQDLSWDKDGRKLGDTREVASSLDADHYDR